MKLNAYNDAILMLILTHIKNVQLLFNNSSILIYFKYFNDKITIILNKTLSIALNK